MKRRRQPISISGLPLHKNGHDNPVHKFKSVCTNKSKKTIIIATLLLYMLVHVGLSRIYSGSTAYIAPNHDEDVAHLKMNLQLQFPKVTRTLSFTPSNQKCKPRDLSPYAHGKASIKHDEISHSMYEANCMRFRCSTNIKKCDNTLPTDYSGPEPPCCVHILRDMAQIFDEEMCRIGLDYSAAFGTLLGFARSDRLIAWTGDNDYVLPSREVANAMVALWDAKSTGIAHLRQGLNRICITRDFANGNLARWEKYPALVNKILRAMKVKDELWSRGFPYIDLYVGQKVPNWTTETALASMEQIRERRPQSEVYQIHTGCQFFHDDIFPTKKVLVYAKNFTQNVPKNSEQLLRTSYGTYWRIPANNDPHGGKPCPYSPVI